jgi:hypothetical protein
MIGPYFLLLYYAPSGLNLGDISGSQGVALGWYFPAFQA